MAILPLVIAPDPRLNQRSEPVAVVDDAVRKLLDDMLETMYANDGIGLAAVQVGVHKRCIVMDVAMREGRNEPIKLVNPEIVESAEEISVYQEGCLSFPDQFSDVERPESVTVKYLNELGEEKLLRAEGIMATCVQHEIDHINGVVFVDHISKLKREMILKKLTKAKKLGLVSEFPVPVHD
ncbi:MAG: peptide deformylase [Azospirillum brasilense]|nr:MAG: peptide deformylase [Azospirillum brasilense]